MFFVRHGHIKIAMFILSTISVSIMSVYARTANAETTSSNDSGDLHFNPAFLSTSATETIDLTRFEHGASALPGTYVVDIYVNDENVSKQEVNFKEYPDKSVRPCLTKDILKEINFNEDNLSSSFNKILNSNQECLSLETLIPDSKATFDSGEQRLDISIPQAMMVHNARGYANPALWDKGIPAFLLGYTSNAYTSRSRGKSTNSAWSGIKAGMNVGAWYFRHDGSYDWREESGGHYQSTDAYVQRDIPAIKGRVLMGTSNTRGNLFDTLPFKGVELINEDRMLPQSRRGYAPEIRGIARTNAQIVVSQNDRVIYKTTVPPGAFYINDLYPSGYGGDLDVRINEADGSVQTFRVLNGAASELLRPGSQHYDVVVGRLNNTHISSNPVLNEAIYQRGITNSITGYGGIQLGGAEYYALMLGMSAGTNAGAISADVTQARVHLASSEEQANRSDAISGQRFKVNYSKSLPETGSALNLSVYRYTRSGFYDFQSAMSAIDERSHDHSVQSSHNLRNRVSTGLSQDLYEGWGQIYLTGYVQDYWDKGSHADIQYQMGYGNNWHRLSYGLSAGRVRDTFGKTETTWQLTLSMPLGAPGSNNTPFMNANMNHSSNGKAGQQMGVSGTTGDEHEYNYGMSAMHYNQGAGSSAAINGGWRSSYSSLNSTYGHGKNYDNASVGASGTVIAWRGGVVASPYTGDNFAVVEAKGAHGAKVGNYSGVHIDPWGHAAVPYLSPYEMNEISIDPKGLGYDVELDNTTIRVAPFDGAVSKIVYKTEQGIPLLIQATRENGDVVPFGADIFDSKGKYIGSAGQMGQVFAHVQQKKGRLQVRWGQTATEQCQIDYQLSDASSDDVDSTHIFRAESVCR
ncbi:MAG TPA: fimbria/pilus outer membrane usher protein [Buttiauxella sp.]|jgi:outer membrane usher protein